MLRPTMFPATSHKDCQDIPGDALLAIGMPGTWEKNHGRSSGSEQMEVPSGYVKIAIGNDHRNSGFSHEQWVDFQ